MDELVRLAAVGGAHPLCVPLEPPLDTIRDVAEQRRLGERAGVLKIARGRAAVRDGVNPFLVVTNGIRNGLGRRNEAIKFFSGSSLWRL